MLRAQKFSIVILVLIIFCLSLLGYLLHGHPAPDGAEQDFNLEVDFLDVGQGDSILIKTPFEQNILIDGGPDNSVINQLGKNLPFYDKTIDLMVLTHPDADHVTGLPEVLNRYKVKKVLYTGLVHTTPAFLEWLRLIKEKNIPMQVAVAGQKINLGQNLDLEILWPDKSYEGQRVEENNMTSIVAKLVYGQTTFLFTGDAPVEVEDVMIGETSTFRLRSDVLKVAHHGSKNSSSKDFLQAVRPKYAIIPVGKDNKFGHPSLRVLDSLKDLSINILRTDLGGAIKCTSDKIEVNCGYK